MSQLSTLMEFQDNINEFFRGAKIEIPLICFSKVSAWNFKLKLAVLNLRQRWRLEFPTLTTTVIS